MKSTPDVARKARSRPFKKGHSGKAAGPETKTSTAGEGSPGAKAEAQSGKGPKILEVPDFFFRPSLIHGERAEDFDALLKLIQDAIAPTNFIEVMWVKDVTELSWEMHRARRLRAIFIDAVHGEMAAQAFSNAVTTHMEAGKSEYLPADVRAKHRKRYEQIREKAKTAVAGDADPVETANEIAAEVSPKIDHAAVQSKSYVLAIGQLEKVDGLIAALDRRIESVLREVEYRRALVTERIRRGVEDFLAAEAMKKTPSATPKHGVPNDGLGSAAPREPPQQPQ